MASKSLAEYFGDVFLNQSRFDADHLFKIWQQLANRRDELFVEYNAVKLAHWVLLLLWLLLLQALHRPQAQRAAPNKRHYQLRLAR